MRHLFAKFPDPVLNSRKFHGGTGVVGRLHHAKIPREVKGLVHVQGRDELAGNEVAAGVAGNDDGKQGLIIKSRGTE